MKKLSLRVLCVCLILCLLPLSGFAEGYDTEPLYRSDFSLSFHLDPEAFPNDGAAHYSDWQKLFDRLIISGTMDYQRPTDFLDQYVRMDASVLANGEEAFPFQYESYGVTRFFHTPSMGEDYLYFNMMNFWQFMLKPYYFLGLPTNLLSMLIGWDMTAYTAKDFVDMVKAQMKDQTDISARSLRIVANRISKKFANRKFSLYYSFLQGFLGIIYGDMLISDDISRLAELIKTYPSYKDGLHIITEGDTTCYRIGSVDVLTIDGDGWRFHMPDDQGYVFDMELRRDEDTLQFTVKASLGEETRLDVSLLINGLKTDDRFRNEGDLLLDISGGALADNLPQDHYALQLHYTHERSSLSLPRSESFTLDWIHPDTGKAAIGVCYNAILQEADGKEIKNERKNHEYMCDFFSMNSDVLAEMKQKYLKPVAVSLVPLALEIPLGVYSDVFAFLKNTGFLAMLGIEGL